MPTNASTQSQSPAKSTAPKEKQAPQATPAVNTEATKAPAAQQASTPAATPSTSSATASSQPQSYSNTINISLGESRAEEKPVVITPASATASPAQQSITKADVLELMHEYMSQQRENEKDKLLGEIRDFLREERARHDVPVAENGELIFQGRSTSIGGAGQIEYRERQRLVELYREITARQQAAEGPKQEQPVLSGNR